MWQIVKENGIKNKGQNIWVYQPDESVFAGVELDQPRNRNSELQQKRLHLKNTPTSNTSAHTIY